MDKYPALTKRQAEVYDLHKAGKSHDEISKELNIKLRTSEALLYQARKKMKACKETLKNA